MRRSAHESGNSAFGVPVLMIGHKVSVRLNGIRRHVRNLGRGFNVSVPGCALCKEIHRVVDCIS